MTTMASQITSLTVVYSIVYSDADQRNHQSSASLAFVRGIHRSTVNSPHKWPVTRKRFHLLTSSCARSSVGTMMTKSGPWHLHFKYQLLMNLLWFQTIVPQTRRPLGDIIVIFNVVFPNTFYNLSAYFFVKLLSVECHRTYLIINQYCIR